MSDLKTAKRNKKGLKASITKFKEKINVNIEEADLASLQVFETKVSGLHNELKETFDSIYSHCEEKEIDEFIIEKEAMLQNLDDISLIIERKLLTINSVTSKSCDNTSTKNTSVSEIKLPKLSLPTFSGKIDEWIEFHDLFCAAVHNNQNLTNAQKLQYLKSSCKNDALDIIHSISICDANYEIAWNLLIDRYSNKKDLINAVIKRLLSLPQTCDSSQSLLKFVDNINDCLRSLEVLDQKVINFSDTLILHVLVEKLDKSTRSWWERTQNKDELGTINQLTTFLKEHSRTLQHSKSLQREPRRFQSKTLTSTSENAKVCVYCKGFHIILKCPQFLNLSVKKRFNFVKEKKLCFNCLSAFHSVNACKSNNTCRKCSRYHHTLLHLERDREEFTVARVSSPNQGINNPTTNSNLSPSATPPARSNYKHQ